MTSPHRVLDMILAVLKQGEHLHYNEITRRVIQAFPDWDRGKTPEASVRGTLNYCSDRHPEVGEIHFHVEPEDGYYSCYDPSGLLPSVSLRVRALVEFAKHTGEVVPATVLQRTRSYWPAVGVSQIHPLMSGIYKPQNQNEALCIKMGINSPYADHLEFLKDGRWTLSYDQRGEDPNHSDNRALQKCMESAIPVGVVQQVKSKLEGSRYLIVGLGMIRSFQSAQFQIESAMQDEVRRFAGLAEPVLQEELVLSNSVTDQFNLMGDREIREGTLQRPVRNEAFKRLLRRHYQHTCAVCQSKFYLSRTGQSALIEVQGAHIVPVEDGGTDDLRNGLALCRRHHWSLDAGLFTVSPAYKIRISPQVAVAQRNKFDLEVYEGETILLPDIENIRPHKNALEWHNDEVFLKND